MGHGDFLPVDLPPVHMFSRGLGFFFGPENDVADVSRHSLHILYIAVHRKYLVEVLSCDIPRQLADLELKLQHPRRDNTFAFLAGQ